MKYFPQSSKYLNNNTSEARRCLTHYEEKQWCHDDVIYQYIDLPSAKREAPVYAFYIPMRQLPWTTDKTKLSLSPSAKQLQIIVLGPHLWTGIWVREMIGILKMPLSINQSGWKEIRNAFPVIRWVRWEARTRILALVFRLN